MTRIALRVSILLSPLLLRDGQSFLGNQFVLELKAITIIVSIRKTKLTTIHNETLIPGDFILAWTAETVSLPVLSRYAARVEGKSGLARLGLLVHLTAPIIHAGYRGQIQLEMVNLGPNEVSLDVGMPICQLVFEMTLGTPVKGYTGRYFGQAPP